MNVVVTHVRDIGTEMKLFGLARSDGKPFPGYQAGAHVDVVTPSGHVRQYSLCNDPRDCSTRSILVKKEHNSRGGSASMHRLNCGDILEIGETRSAFSLRDERRPCLLISAGVGITPIVSMAYQLAFEGAKFRWQHFARSSHLSDLRDALSLARFDANLTVSTDIDRYRVPAKVESLLTSDNSPDEIYVCGPAGFISAIREAATRLLPNTHVYSETFDPIRSPKDSLPFFVRLMRTDISFEVSGQQTLIDALESNGVRVPSSCKQGICGACATRVISGMVIHMDEVLTDSEKNEENLMCPCISRGEGTLILDL